MFLNAPVFTSRRPVEGHISFGAGQPKYGGPRPTVHAQVAPGLGIPGTLVEGGGHGYMQHQDPNGNDQGREHLFQVS